MRKWPPNGSRSRQVSPVYRNCRSLSGAFFRRDFSRNSPDTSPLTDTGHVLTIVVNGQEVELRRADQAVEVVINRTPILWGVRRTGWGMPDESRDDNFGNGCCMIPSKILPDLIIHKGKVQSGTIRKNQTVTLSVDSRKSGLTLPGIIQPPIFCMPCFAVCWETTSNRPDHW